MKEILLKKGMILAIALIIFSTVLVAFQGNVFAEGSAMPDISSIEGAGNSAAADSVGNVIGAVFYILKIVAVGVALIMLTVLAIKYMSSAPNDRASIKKHAVVYVVGAIVLFGAAGILQIIEKFSSNISAS